MAWSLERAVPRSIRRGGKLLLDPPKDWNAVVSGPAFGRTVRLTPEGGGAFEVLITAIVSRKKLPDDAAVNFTSWNQLGKWLRQIDGLRRVA